MTQKTITCKYCEDHQQVLYDPDLPTNKVSNLDGSYHKHTKSQQPQQSYQQQQSFGTSKEDNYAARQEAIDQAHKENMSASERLAKSIDNLAAVIDRAVNILRGPQI